MGTRLNKPLQQSWGGIPAEFQMQIAFRLKMLSISKHMHDVFALLSNDDSHLPLCQKNVIYSIHNFTEVIDFLLHFPS